MANHRRKHAPKEMLAATKLRRRTLLEEVLAKLDTLDDRLVVLDEAIREVQPKTNGAIIMQFKMCQRVCMGCPHIEWVKWYDPSKQHKSRTKGWHRSVVTHPLRYTSSRVANPAKSLIEEAVGLLTQREKVIARLKSLGAVAHHITNAESHHDHE